jgi:hypothetical protein
VTWHDPADGVTGAFVITVCGVWDTNVPARVSDPLGLPGAAW